MLIVAGIEGPQSSGSKIPALAEFSCKKRPEQRFILVVMIIEFHAVEILRLVQRSCALGVGSAEHRACWDVWQHRVASVHEYMGWTRYEMIGVREQKIVGVNGGRQITQCHVLWQGGRHNAQQRPRAWGRKVHR